MTKVHYTRSIASLAGFICAMSQFVFGCSPKKIYTPPPDIGHELQVVVRPTAKKANKPKPALPTLVETGAWPLQPVLTASLAEEDPPPPDSTPVEIARDFLREAMTEYDSEYHIIRRGNPNLMEVALTFDDGPHPEFLPRLLDTLRELDIHVTFFVVGEKVAQAPETLMQIVQDGHEIGNHTYHHLNLTTIPLDYIERDIKSDSDIIRQSCSVQPRFFRPPGGRCDDDVFRIAREQHLTTVLWTDDPADFAKPGAEEIERRLLRHVRPGAIILLHSGVEQTLEMLPDFVAQLQQAGYRFVTMSEMMKHRENHSRIVAR